MKYWVNTVSRDHVARGVSGGFTQADHGRPSRIAKLEKGDWMVFYSPRTEFRAGEPLRAFTAIGRIADDVPYQVTMTDTFRPWRRNMEFVESREAPIAPLVGQLEFIASAANWGFAFRRGLFEMGAADFRRIADAMRARIDALAFPA